jgi:hypothetical protein
MLNLRARQWPVAYLSVMNERIGCTLSRPAGRRPCPPPSLAAIPPHPAVLPSCALGRAPLLQTRCQTCVAHGGCSQAPSPALTRAPEGRLSAGCGTSARPPSAAAAPPRGAAQQPAHRISAHGFTRRQRLCSQRSNPAATCQRAELCARCRLPAPATAMPPHPLRLVAYALLFLSACRQLCLQLLNRNLCSEAERCGRMTPQTCAVPQTDRRRASQQSHTLVLYSSFPRSSSSAFACLRSASFWRSRLCVGAPRAGEGGRICHARSAHLAARLARRRTPAPATLGTNLHLSLAG